MAVHHRNFEMKRDRWDSSEDEDDTAACNQSHPQSTVRKTFKDDAPSLVKHNPLLHGCRSVYDCYDRLDRISEGAYGVVWKAKDLATQDIVALKQIKFESDMTKEGFPMSALREINILLSLSHECVVTVREMVVGSALDKVFMVMEFMEMDLKEAINIMGKDPFSQSELKGMLFQILSGVQHIHRKWLLHRDIKTSNVLVHKSGRIALADFGLARKYQDPLRPLTQMVITLWYRPPELLFGETVYGPAVDMWSVGCVLGELITKDAILQGEGELDQIDKIFRLVGVPNEKNWPDFDKLPSSGILRWKPLQHGSEFVRKFPINSPAGGQTFLDQNGFDLLSNLLKLDPQQRISADKALRHKYFQEGVAKATPRFHFRKK
jgi:cell division cycle 2-like